MKYFIDIDGVIRNFTDSIRRYPGLENLPCDKWQRLPNDLWRDMDRNPKFYLYDCEHYQKMVDFINIILRLENCVFLTNQCRIPQREYWTVKFIEKIFGKRQLVLFTGNFQEKVDILKYNESFKLFDDYPFFHEKEGFEEIADRIVLVDQPWNKNDQHKYENILSL